MLKKIQKTIFYKKKDTGFIYLFETELIGTGLLIILFIIVLLLDPFIILKLFTELSTDRMGNLEFFWSVVVLKYLDWIILLPGV